MIYPVFWFDGIIFINQKVYTSNRYFNILRLNIVMKEKP